MLEDNLVSPGHIAFLVPQHACVAGCMLRVTYMVYGADKLNATCTCIEFCA
jgi:hypothetical protein